MVRKNRNPTEKNPGNLMPPTHQSQSLDGMLPMTSCVESSYVNTVSNVDTAQLLDSANVSPSTVVNPFKTMFNTTKDVYFKTHKFMDHSK